MLPVDVVALLEHCAPSVAPSTMAAILRVESGFRPNAIGTTVRGPGGTFVLQRQPRDKDEAVSWAYYMHRSGLRFDAGAAQVNSANFERFGLTPETAFEPCLNINAAASILTLEYLRASKRFGEGQAALRAAISSYNTGSFTAGYANGYVSSVTKAASRGAAPAVSRPPLLSQ